MDRPKRAVALDDDLVIAVTAKIIADPEMNAEVALERIIAFRDATRTWWSLGTAVLAIEGKRFWTGYSPAQLGVPGEPFKSLRDFITRVLGKGRATTYRARRCRAILDAMGRDNALRLPNRTPSGYASTPSAWVPDGTAKSFCRRPRATRKRTSASGFQRQDGRARQRGSEEVVSCRADRVAAA